MQETKGAAGTVVADRFEVGHDSLKLDGSMDTVDKRKIAFEIGQGFPREAHAMAEEGPDEDMTAVIRHLERAAGVEVGSGAQRDARGALHRQKKSGIVGLYFPELILSFSFGFHYISIDQTTENII